MNHSKGQLAALLISILLVFPGIAAADGHWLFGGAIGTASIDESIDGFRFDADSTAYRLYGGYQFNEYFALEAGYLNLGSFDEQIQQGGEIVPISADADGFTFAVRASVPLGQKFDLHGTVGSFFWDGSNEIAGVGDLVEGRCGQIQPVNRATHFFQPIYPDVVIQLIEHRWYLFTCPFAF